jgi:hypothetical protein
MPSEFTRRMLRAWLINMCSMRESKPSKTNLHHTKQMSGFVHMQVAHTDVRFQKVRLTPRRRSLQSHQRGR